MHGYCLGGGISPPSRSPPFSPTRYRLPDIPSLLQASKRLRCLCGLRGRFRGGLGKAVEGGTLVVP